MGSILVVQYLNLNFLCVFYVFLDMLSMIVFLSSNSILIKSCLKIYWATLLGALSIL
jgi:hypothetical protein